MPTDIEVTDGETTSLLRLRVPRQKKGEWVRAARERAREDGSPGTLMDFVCESLDRAASGDYLQEGLPPNETKLLIKLGDTYHLGFRSSTYIVIGNQRLLWPEDARWMVLPR